MYCRLAHYVQDSRLGTNQWSPSYQLWQHVIQFFFESLNAEKKCEKATLQDTDIFPIYCTDCFSFEEWTSWVGGCGVGYFFQRTDKPFFFHQQQNTYPNVFLVLHCFMHPQTLAPLDLTVLIWFIVLKAKDNKGTSIHICCKTYPQFQVSLS